MSSSRLNIALAVIAAVVILLPMAEGFALSTGYTATTVNSNNTISSEYFTIGFYNKGGTEESPIYTPVEGIATCSIYYVQSGTNRIVVGDQDLTPESIYLKVSNNVVTPTLSFNLSDPVISLHDGESDITASATYTVTVDGTKKWTTASPSWTDSSISDSDYHSISVVANFGTTGYTILNSISISVTIGVKSSYESHDRTTGLFVESHSCTLEETTIENEISVINPDLTSDGYVFNEVTGSDYGNFPATILEGNDSHGISRQNDHGKYVVDVTVNIPTGYEFVLCLNPNGALKSMLKVTVDYPNHEPSQYVSSKIDATGNIKQFVCIDDKGAVKPIQSIDAVISYYHWFPSGTGVRVTVENFSGADVDQRVQLIFILNAVENNP